MNKTTLQDTQKTHNLMRTQIDVVDVATKWAAPDLMFALGTNVLDVTKTMPEPESKTVTHPVFILKTKVIK